MGGEHPLVYFVSETDCFRVHRSQLNLPRFFFSA
jgi:hypothetical protein